MCGRACVCVCVCVSVDAYSSVHVYESVMWFRLNVRISAYSSVHVYAYVAWFRLHVRISVGKAQHFALADYLSCFEGTTLCVMEG